MENKEGKVKRFLTTFSIYFITLFVGLTLGLFVRRNITEIYNVVGTSMENTLHDGDKIIADKTFRLKKDYDKIKKEDIIVFTHNKDFLVKRVIAKQGDRVVINEDGYVYLNNEKLDENYLDEDKKGITEQGSYNKITVPKDMVFVLGDNRNPNKSMDSRHFGLVHKEQIQGVLKFRLLPFNLF